MNSNGNAQKRISIKYITLLWSWNLAIEFFMIFRLLFWRRLPELDQGLRDQRGISVLSDCLRFCSVSNGPYKSVVDLNSLRFKIEAKAAFLLKASNNSNKQN